MAKAHTEHNLVFILLLKNEIKEITVSEMEEKMH